MATMITHKMPTEPAMLEIWELLAQAELKIREAHFASDSKDQARLDSLGEARSYVLSAVDALDDASV